MQHPSATFHLVSMGRSMDGLVDSHDMCQTKSFVGFGHN